MGFSHVFVELDALFIVNFMLNRSKVHPCLMTLVDDCRSLLQRIPNVHVSHIYCEGNTCTDAMANLGRTQSINFALFSSSPDSVQGLVDFDSSTEACLRFVSPSFQGVSSVLVNQKKKSQNHLSDFVIRCIITTRIQT